MDEHFFETVYNHPFPVEDYRAIRDAHTRVEVRKGGLILEIGKIAKAFYVIERGVVRSFLYNYRGDETTTGFFCPTEIAIASFSLFQRLPAKENFQALTDAVVWKIDYGVFQELLDRLEGLREWGRNWATRELFSLKQHSISVLTMEAKERYLALIREKPEVVKGSPLKYIASYLGITDSSLSRIRREISAC